MLACVVRPYAKPNIARHHCTHPSSYLLHAPDRLLIDLIHARVHVASLLLSSRLDEWVDPCNAWSIVITCAAVASVLNDVTAASNIGTRTSRCRRTLASFAPPQAPSDTLSLNAHACTPHNLGLFLAPDTEVAALHSTPSSSQVAKRITSRATKRQIGGRVELTRWALLLPSRCAQPPVASSRTNVRKSRTCCVMMAHGGDHDRPSAHAREKQRKKAEASSGDV